MSCSTPIHNNRQNYSSSCEYFNPDIRRLQKGMSVIPNFGSVAGSSRVCPALNFYVHKWLTWPCVSCFSEYSKSVIGTLFWQFNSHSWNSSVSCPCLSRAPCGVRSLLHAYPRACFSADILAVRIKSQNSCQFKGDWDGFQPLWNVRQVSTPLARRFVSDVNALCSPLPITVLQPLSSWNSGSVWLRCQLVQV